MIKKLLTSTLLLSLLSVLVPLANANEGIIQMKAQDGTAGVCEVYSNLLDNFQYSLSVNCRGLKYPISQNLFQYALWTDVGEGNYNFMGTLGIGKRQFSAPGSFSRIIITKEAGREPKTPSENLYMSGQPRNSAFIEQSGIDLLNEIPATPEPVKAINDEGASNFGSTAGENETATDGLGNAIRILGAVVVFIVAIVIAIAFISASRRRPVSI